MFEYSELWREAGRGTADVRMRVFVRSWRPSPRKFREQKKKKSMDASFSSAWKESDAHPPYSSHRSGHPDQKKTTFPESKTLVFFVLQWWVASKVHFSHYSRLKLHICEVFFVAQRVATNVFSAHNKCLRLNREGLFLFHGVAGAWWGHTCAWHENPPNLSGLRRIVLLL